MSALRRLAALTLALTLLPAVADARPLKKRTWLAKVTLTEYYPAPEKWFDGKLVSAPGLDTKHRVDWLYSSRGLSMEGDGVGLDGRRYHINSVGDGGWINEFGRVTSPGRSGWYGGAPVWRKGGYWKNRKGRPTYPLQGGGWSNGRGVKRVGIPDGIEFGEGPSRPLTYYRSIAVDPDLIPMGSRVYIGKYKGVKRASGWFVAADTGGAIQGRHIDVFRSPPASKDDQGESAYRQRVLVLPPGVKARKGDPPDRPAASDPDEPDPGAPAGDPQTGGLVASS